MTVQSLKALGAQVQGFVADVTIKESLNAAFHAVVATYGRLDVVFANAGFSAGPGFLKGNGERDPDGEVETFPRKFGSF